jgi:sarcosine oxidase subunit delta
MSFLVECPNCGERGVNEFRFGGEASARPAPDASHEEWTHYVYSRRNVAGDQSEWWYHKFGCRRWFMALRNTVTNEVSRTYWPELADR